MGEYGSGVSLQRALMYDKERIKHALKGELICGEDENGFKYAPGDKAECDAFIIGAFDNVAYHCIQALHAGQAYDHILKNRKIKVSPTEYIHAIAQAESGAENEYKYEDDEEDDRK